jgi:hypothetical protein
MFDCAMMAFSLGPHPKDTTALCFCSDDGSRFFARDDGFRAIGEQFFQRQLSIIAGKRLTSSLQKKRSPTSTPSLSLIR